MTAGRIYNNHNKEWGTPKKYVDVIHVFFKGVIDLDPCSNQYSIVNAKTEYILPQDDGLVKTWDFKNIYVNPPYGIDKECRTSIKKWLDKCTDTHQKFQSEILALIPVATNTKHWKNNVFGIATAVCFLYDTRLKFLINGEEKGKGAPMACAFIYWGKYYNKFLFEFNKFGAVVDLRLLKDNKK